MKLESAPAYVGVTTLVIGAALVAKPDLLSERLDLDETAVRVIGLSDLVLVPGLLKGGWPWMLARAATNVAVAAYLHPRSISKVMLGLTVIDGGTALALRQAASA